MGTNHVE